jgi:pyridoxal 5'-phosphate synthase pdxT subunit
LKIGVLAAQGAFIEHIHALERLKIETAEVRLRQDLEELDGLIIPGGESTTITKLMLAYNLSDRIKELVAKGMPVMGTCAGMIVLANNLVDGNGVQSLKVIDITVRRNAFGRQVDSFETDIQIGVLGKNPFHAVFIRAPLIESVGKNVEVLARLEDKTIVAAQQGKILVLSFHPELTDDLRMHRYFVELVKNN